MSRTPLNEFMHGLSSTRLDRFVRVMQRLAGGSSEAAMMELQAQYDEIRAELDRIDQDRNQLTSHQHDLRGTLEDLDKALARTPGAPDLIQLRLLLQQVEAEIEAEIAASRPVELLAEKARLRQEIVRRRLTGQLAASLGESVRSEARR